MKPTWSKFWGEYPDYWNFPDSEQVKADIGGGVNADYITNTCVVRLSRGLNYSGVPVPGNRAGLVTVKGADKKRYALRVAEIRPWLPEVLGKPDFDLKKKAGEAFDPATLAATKGIVGFDISFRDATGHFDAWNGRVFSNEHKHPEYWTLAKRITLWALA